MPNASDFRRIVLGMEGAIESAHMAHPDFRVNGRIFATLQHDPQWAMVSLTPEQQARFLREDRAFAPAAGAWGRSGSTLVDLQTVDEETLGEAATLAWRNAVNRPQKRR
jgi:hypothetical protein